MNVAEPIVKFDPKNRATLVSSSTFMSVKTRGRSKRRRKNSPKVVKGRLSLKVKGYPGVQRLAPSHLVPFLPISKLRAAALQHLKKTKTPRVVKKSRKGKKGSRKGRKKGKRKSKK